MWMTEESDKINSDKIEDERREKRHGLIKRAKIVVGNSVIDCAVVNVSTSGARVRTGAVVVVPEHVVLRFSGGSAFVAQRRWSRGMEMGFVLNGPAPLTEHAALTALSAFEALPSNDLEAPIRILRDARFFDDPVLGQAAEEVEAAYARFKAILRARIALKPLEPND
jgi:hypothetical protein